jgi:hypothetical protein
MRFLVGARISLHDFGANDRLLDFRLFVTAAAAITIAFAHKIPLLVVQPG